LARSAPVNAPRSCPNSSLSSSDSVKAPQLTARNGPLPRAVDALRDQLLAGAGLALDQHRDRGRGGALHQPQQLAQRGARADDLGERIAALAAALQRADLEPQVRLRGLQARVHLRVLDRGRDEAREALEEQQVVRTVRRLAGGLRDRQEPDRPAAGDERCGQNGADREAQLARERGVVARIARRVDDQLGAPALEDRAAEPGVERQGDVAQLLRVDAVRVGAREVHPAGVVVDQQHAAVGLRTEDRMAAADDGREELLELGVRGERVRQLVEQLEARSVEAVQVHAAKLYDVGRVRQGRSHRSCSWRGWPVASSKSRPSSGRIASAIGRSTRST
jgi:hypothetical protein